MSSPTVAVDTLPGVLAHWARRQPDAPAVRFGRLSWSWAELAGRVARLAAALRADGVEPGDRVALLDLNHPAFLELTLACARLGAVQVVLNSRVPAAEMVYVLNDAGVVLVVAGRHYPQLVDRLRAAGALPLVRRTVRLGGLDDEYEAWLNTEPDETAHPAGPDDCFLQLYTSGTTGHPKGVMLTHRGLLANAADLAAATGLDRSGVVLAATPLHQVNAAGQALVAVCAGATLVISRAPEPSALVELMLGEGVSHAYFVPGLLAEVVGSATRRFPALRTLLCGGAAPSPALLRECRSAFPDVFTRVYGMTEAWGVVSLIGAGEEENRPSSVGRPLNGVRVQIRDPAIGMSLPVGEPGEVCLFSRQLMVGYWNRPDASAGAIGDDGWFRTGDGGWLDAEGFLHLTDRIRDVIVGSGEYIYPSEVERVLATHPAVAASAVIGVPDPLWGEVPKALVVPVSWTRPVGPELIAHCRAHLAPYQCPTSVELVESLPRNHAGEVLKKELRERHLS